MSMLTTTGPGGPFIEAAEGPATLLRILRERSIARLRHWGLSFLGAAGIAGIAALAMAGGPVGQASAAKSAAPPKNPWIEVNKPLRFYALESAEFGKEPRLYEARRNTEGGGRRDTMYFGAAAPGKEPSLALSIYRVGGEDAPESRFFVDMARQAALAGHSVARSAQPGDMPTRFGAFEVADIMLAAGNGEAACLGFRLGVAKPGLRITGYACGSPSRPVDRRALACALDRLDLASAGDDRDLGKFFAGAEQARGAGCGGAKGGAAQKANWLESAKPALRAGDSGQKVARK